MIPTACRGWGALGWLSSSSNVAFWHCRFPYRLPSLPFVMLEVRGEKRQAESVVWCRGVHSPACFPRSAPPADSALQRPLSQSLGPGRSAGKGARYRMFRFSLWCGWLPAGNHRSQRSLPLIEGQVVASNSVARLLYRWFAHIHFENNFLCALLCAEQAAARRTVSLASS